MGGYGSTRWDGVRTRPITDSCLRIEMSKYVRIALKQLAISLNQGKNGGGSTVLRWTSRGEPSGLVGLKLAGIVGRGLFAELVYRAGGVDIEEFVKIDTTVQRLGGQRAWWRCPACNQRCITLYCPSWETYFRCRACHNVAYRTQAESDKNAYALARRMQGGDRPDVDSFGAMSCRGLITVMKAGDLMERRQARAMARVYGPRRARRLFPWLFDKR